MMKACALCGYNSENTSTEGLFPGPGSLLGACLNIRPGGPIGWHPVCRGEHMNRREQSIR